MIATCEDINESISCLKLRGVIDGHSCEELQDQFDELAERNRWFLILDIEQVELMTSRVIGLIFQMMKSSREEHGNIVILKPSEKIYRVLELLEIIHIFPVAYDLEEAIEILNNKPKGSLVEYIRTSIRKPQDNSHILLTDPNHLELLMPICNSSEDGLGVVHVGSKPPRQGEILNLMDDGKVKKQIEVCWVRHLEENIYRIGMRYLVE